MNKNRLGSLYKAKQENIDKLLKYYGKTKQNSRESISDAQQD